MLKTIRALLLGLGCSGGLCGSAFGQCVNAATPSCGVFESCFAQACPCSNSPYEYFRSQGKVQCEALLNVPGLSAQGTAWRDSTLRCLQERIVPRLPAEKAAATCDCKAMNHFAFDAQVACYTQPTASICQLPARDWTRIAAAVDPIGGLIDAQGRKQMLEVARLCLPLVVAESKAQVQTLIDKLSGIAPVPQAAPRLAAFLPLVQSCPAKAAVEAVSALGRHAHIQHIKDAYSDVLHLDDFAVSIAVLPKLPGAASTASPEQLLEFVRTHLNDFLDPQVTSVAPFTARSAAQWAQPATASGALMLFTIHAGAMAAGTGAGQPALPPILPVEQALVVASAVGPEGWRFATVRAGLAAPGEHPVSGVREFGLRHGANGMLQLYTRGIDRPTSLQDHLLARAVFRGQDLNWQRYSEALVRFVHAGGGAAVLEPVFSVALSWRADVVQPALFKDGCMASADSGATASAATAQESAAAAQMLADADASGAVKAIAQSTLARLTASPSTVTRQQVIADTKAIVSQVKAARSPAALLAALDSPEGRALGLVGRTPAWSADEMRFVQSGKPLAMAAHGLIARADGATAQLTLAAADKLSTLEMQQWLSALAQTEQVTPARVLSQLAPPAQRALLGQAFELATRAQAPEAALRDLQQALLGQATKALQQRGGELRQRLGQAQRANATVRSPEFQQLMQGELSARSLDAGASLLAWMGQASGNKALGDDVQRTANQVKSAMALYEGVQTLAMVGSGGAAVAALGLLSGAGGLDAAPGGNNGVQTQQLMNALADLTDLVKNEFAKVNTKLDRISGTLDQISVDLRQLGRVQSQTYEAVALLRGELARLLITMGQFELDLKQRSLDSDEQPCRRYRQGLLSGPLDEKFFYTCLAAYRDWAGARLVFAPASGEALEPALVTHLSATAFTPGEGLWRSAGLVARGANELLRLSAAKAFTSDDQARRLASGVFSAVGVNHYLLWIDRFGAPHVPSKHALLVAQDNLAALQSVLEGQAEFRNALRIPDASRDHILKAFSDDAQGAPGRNPEHAKALAMLNGQLRTGVREQILRSVVGATDSVGRVPPLVSTTITPCDPAATLFGPVAMSGEQLLKAGLPRNMLHFGMRVHDQTTYMNGQRGMAFKLFNQGLRICLDNLRANQDRGGDGVIYGRFLTAQVHVSLGESEICNREVYAESNRRLVAGPGAAASFEMVAQGAVYKALAACFGAMSEAEKANYFAGLVDEVLNASLPDHALKLELLGVWGRLLTEQSARDSLAKVLEPTWARLAFWRAYLALVYPSVWLTDDRLRNDLVSDAALQSTQGLSEGLLCVSAIVDQYLSSADTGTPDLFDMLELAKTQCPRVNFNSLLFGFPSSAVQQYDQWRLRNTDLSLKRTDWNQAQRMDISSDAWLARRLAHFISAGNDAAYWRAVGESPP